jgi:hypothetical protein
VHRGRDYDRAGMLQFLDEGFGLGERLWRAGWIQDGVAEGCVDKAWRVGRKVPPSDYRCGIVLTEAGENLLGEGEALRR